MIFLGKRSVSGQSGIRDRAERKPDLQAQGISGDMVKTVNLDYTEAAAKLADGEIDAFFCTAGNTDYGDQNWQRDAGLLSIDVNTGTG